MTVRLYWTDKNLGEEGHYVYRSDTPMDPNNLPTPLATLGVDVQEYEDNTVVAGNTYYYRVGAYVGSVVKVTDEVTLVAGATDMVAGQLDFYYDMSNVTSTEVIDSTGKYNGLLRPVGGEPTQVVLTNGFALQFNGIDQYLAIEGLFIASDEEIPVLSAGLWFKTTEVYDQILMSFDRSDTFRLGIGSESYTISGGNAGASVWTGTEQYDIGSSNKINDDLWHLLVMVYDNGSITLYKDNKVEAAFDIPGAPSIGPPKLGENRFGFIGVGSEAIVEDGAKGPEYYFKGLITKAFMMRRAMKPEEVMAMYNRGADS